MLITVKDQAKRNTGKQPKGQQVTWNLLVPPAGIEPATPGLGILNFSIQIIKLCSLSAILGVRQKTHLLSYNYSCTYAILRT